MKKSKKTSMIVIFLISIFFSAVSVVTVYAAYYGKGLFKDVFVNKNSYFTSDMLISVSAEDKISQARIQSGGAEKLVSFFNYDLSTGDYNDFDLTFSLYAWLSVENSGKEYSLTYNNNTVTVGTSTRGNPVFRISLHGGSVSSAVVFLSFGIQEETDFSSFPDLYLWAVPEQPSHMSSKTLGALVTPSFSNSYNVSAFFEHDENDSVDEQPAFKYVISASGSVQTDKVVSLKWNSAALIFLTSNPVLPPEVTIKQIDNDDRYDKCIEFTHAEEFYYTLTFFRNMESTDEDNPWKNADSPVTWDMLDRFVSVSY